MTGRNPSIHVSGDLESLEILPKIVEGFDDGKNSKREKCS